MTKLQELIALKEKALAGEYNKHSGICDHLTFTIEEKHLESWGNYSGIYHYPIDVEESCLHPSEQFGELDIWEGRQLEERLSLLDHLIECQKAEEEGN